MSKIALIGSDPELFVGKAGKIVSAIGFIGGTKEQPRPVNLGALQEDNVLLEFNIDPAASLGDFQRNIKAVLDQAKGSIKEFQMEVVEGLSSHLYKIEELESFGHNAFVFGCEPDFNAWTQAMNFMPQDVDPCLRTAGGHIHIGFGHIEEVGYENASEVAQMCDFLLGVPSVLMDKDDRRRQLYGKAGAVRYKQYGVEYRSLSNFWIFSDELTAWAYENALKAYHEKDKLKSYCDVISGDEVQRIINEGDKKAAKRVIEALELKVA